MTGESALLGPRLGAWMSAVAVLLLSLRPSWGLGLEWKTQALRYPVRIADVQPRSPYVPARARRVRRAVELRPGKAAAVWIESGGLLRVTALGTGPAHLRFGRVGGGIDPRTHDRGGDAERRDPRLPVDAQTRLAIDEPGVAMTDRTWYLAQPPGGGAMWYIAASAPVKVLVERPIPRRGRLIWERIRADILAWIDRGGPMPEVPVTPGSDDLERRLADDETIARLLLRAHPRAPALGRALSLWRKAAALTRLSAIRPAQHPYAVRTELDAVGDKVRRIELIDTDEAGAGGIRGRSVSVLGRGYREVAAASKTWKIRVRGPGVLRVEARARLDSDPETGQPIPRDLELTLGGKDELAERDKLRPGETPYERDRPTSMRAVLAHTRSRVVAAGARAAPPWLFALPASGTLAVTTAGDGSSPAGKRPVSGRETLEVPLLAGSHEFYLTVSGGPALVRAEHWCRRDRLRETLRDGDGADDFMRRALSALRRFRPADAPARELLRIFLHEIRAATPGVRRAVEGLPPLLELTAWRTWTRRKDPPIAPFAGRVLDLFARLPAAKSGPERALEWQLRVDFARAFARWKKPRTVARLLKVAAGKPRLPSDIPAGLGAAIADLMVEEPDLRPSLALLAAERSWRERPAHPDRRRRYTAIWRQKTVWGTIAPRRDDRPVEAYTWLSREVEPACLKRPGSPDSGERSPPGAYLLPRDGKCSVEVPPLAEDRKRLARLRIHLSTANHEPGPVEIGVDDQVWHTLGFEALEPVAIAVRPGIHEVYVRGPAGMRALLEPVTTASSTLYRRGSPLRRRWPLRGADGAEVRYPLPDDLGHGPVRVELREVLVHAGDESDGRKPVELKVHTDIGHLTTVVFHPGPADPTLAVHRAPGALSMPGRAVLWLPAGARALWFENRSRRQVVTSVAIRRPKPTVDTGRDTAERGAPEGHDTPGVPGPVNPAARPTDLVGAAGSRCGALASATAESRIAGKLARTLSGEFAREVTRLYRLSRCLVADPDRAVWRLLRAEVTLALQRGDYAGADIDALAATEPDAGVPWFAAYQALVDRVANWRRRAYLRPQPTPLLGSKPTPLSPSLLALKSTPAQLRKRAASVSAFRANGPARELPGPTAAGVSDPVDAYLNARLHRLAGRHREAAHAFMRAYLATGIWQLGLDALVDFNRHFTDHPTEDGGSDASLAYGLARRLDEVVDHHEIRRAIALAGRRSVRQSVRGVDSHAGFERLYLDDAEFEPEPESLVQWAWLAPPWPQEQSRILHPGQGGRVAFRLQAPASVWVQVWCRTRLSVPAPCRLSTRVDQGEAVDTLTPRGDRDPVDLPRARLAAGLHVVEVMLSDAAPEVVASFRVVADRPLSGTDTAPSVTGDTSDRRSPGSGSHPISLRHPSRMYLARDDRPVIITVAGPTTLWVQTRTDTAAPATSARLVAQSLGGGEPIHRRIRLDPDRDDAMEGDPGRRITVSRATETELLLTTPGPYRLAVHSSGGVVMARFAIRRDIAAASESEREATTDDLDAADADADADAWLSEVARRFGGRPGLAFVDAERVPPPWRRLTQSVEVGAGHDDFGLGDLPGTGLSPRFDLTWLVRRRLGRRLWLGTDLWLRTRPSSALAAGGRLAAHVRGPSKLRWDVSGDFAIQSVDMGQAWSARGRATVSWWSRDRRTRLGRLSAPNPSLWLVPALSYEYRLYSLDEHPGTAELDPRVFTTYGRQHFQALIPGLTAYWLPFQAQRLSLSVGGRSNANLTSFDFVGGRLAWRGMLEGANLHGPIVEVGYRAGWRFVDSHRLPGYLRHDPSISLLWSPWRHRGGRLTMDVSYRGYLAAEREDYHLFRVGLRYDWLGGRGLVDLFPQEVAFDDFEEPRMWSPSN